MPSTANFLKDLDYSVVQQCMRCGMCLPTCPTYDATQLERHSPRGRIALMRSIADGDLQATKTFSDEMYYCLGCLACVTACPAGVDYAQLFERARAEAESADIDRSLWRRFIRKATLGWLFMDLKRLKDMGFLMRIYQQLGIQALIRKSKVLHLFPKRLRELEAMTPQIQPRFTEGLVPEHTPARGERRFRVAVLSGCAQDLIYSNVNRDTVEVLAENGCDVYTPRDQDCCGSLHAHNGEWRMAQRLARRNIDQFPPEEFDAIISNAGGCGSHLKNYSHFLHDDPNYITKAHAWDSKIKDINEWLIEIDARAPNASTSKPQSITYHESCHLCHGQQISQQPRDLLKLIPGAQLTELPESSWCCGSAGVYNLTQPETAMNLRERKINNIRSTDANIVTTGNPGCLLQLEQGIASSGCSDSIRVAHPVSILAEAYRNESKQPQQPI